MNQNNIWDCNTHGIDYNHSCWTYGYALSHLL